MCQQFWRAGIVIESESNDDEIPTLSVSNDTNYELEGVVNGIRASMLADTGAAVTVMSKEFWIRLRLV